MNILVVVDMQNDFINGSLGTKEAQGIVNNVSKEINAGYDYIFLTQDTHLENYLSSQEGKFLPVEHCILGTYGWEINDKVKSAALTHNATFIQKDIFGRNPIFYLFINAMNDIKKEDPISSLSYLLDSYNEHHKKDKFDLNAKDILGNSLIFYAVEADAVYCVSSLLNKGVKILQEKNLENDSRFDNLLI